MIIKLGLTCIFKASEDKGRACEFLENKLAGATTIILQLPTSKLFNF